MKKALRAIGIALRVLAFTLIGLLLVYNIYTLVARHAFGVGIPTVFGYGFAVVETGSMEPAIAAGDCILIHAEEDYAVGDLITFLDADRGQYVTHRIVLRAADGFITKGDANSGQDPFTVPQSAVVGKVVGVLGGFGKFIAFVQTPFGILVLLAAGAAVWGAAALLSFLLRRRAEQKQAAGGEKAENAAEEKGESGGKDLR